MRKLGKTPIRCPDTPGFVVNRVLIPLLNDCVRVLDEAGVDAGGPRRGHEARRGLADGAVRAARPRRRRRARPRERGAVREASRTAYGAAARASSGCCRQGSSGARRARASTRTREGFSVCPGRCLACSHGDVPHLSSYPPRRRAITGRGAARGATRLSVSSASPRHATRAWVRVVDAHEVVRVGGAQPVGSPRGVTRRISTPNRRAASGIVPP